MEFCLGAVAREGYCKDRFQWLITGPTTPEEIPGPGTRQREASLCFFRVWAKSLEGTAQPISSHPQCVSREDLKLGPKCAPASWYLPGQTQLHCLIYIGSGLSQWSMIVVPQNRDVKHFVLCPVWE